MQYAVYCKLAERNNEMSWNQNLPNIFMLRWWCWKNFLITAITEYLRRVLRDPSQNLDNPSVLVTAST